MPCSTLACVYLYSLQKQGKLLDHQDELHWLIMPLIVLLLHIGAMYLAMQLANNVCALVYIYQTRLDNI